MSLVNDNSIKYFKRAEEELIYNNICTLDMVEKR